LRNVMIFSLDGEPSSVLAIAQTPPLRVRSIRRR
jgi:hypothetical protein